MLQISDGVKKWSVLAPTAALPARWRVAARRAVLARLELAKARRTDLLIIAHPKSGNTWLRVMLSRLYQVRHGLPASLIVTSDELARKNPAIPRITATNGYYSYEGAVGDALAPDAPDSPLRHKPIVFLARHPCDIAVSWFFQFTKRQSAHKQELINHFVDHPVDRRTIGMWKFVRYSDIGLPSLIEYLNTWERNVARLPRATVVRYEDLRENPRGTLPKITALLGEKFSDREIEEAVAFGSFDNLKNLERRGFFRQGGLSLRNPKDPESFKVRRAKVGGFKDYFTADQVAELEELVRTRLSPTFGYPPTAAPARRSAPAGGAVRSSAPEIAAPPHPVTPGRVWLLLGDKPGDNAQVEAVAEALGWRCERKTLHWRAPYSSEKPRFRVTVDHLDRSRSASLEPPWPDLILTIGRRPSMVALWLKEKSARRTRIVLFGKPSGLMTRFDLVVAGAEVQLPPLPNVLPIRLSLMRPRASDIEAAVALWQPRLAGLPRPLIALLVGGPTVPFAFDHRVSERLGRLAAEIAAAGGTPYVTTSRRTPRAVVEALRAELPPGAQLFEWTPESADNPYLALLGLADGFIVTGDSVSMMAEVVRAGKPLAILELPLGRLGAIDQTRRSLLRRLFRADSGHIRQLVISAACRAHLLDATRDFRAFHRALFDCGLAVRAGAPLAPPNDAVPDDLPAVAARIKRLIEAA